MKMTKLTTTALATALTLAFSAQAADDRYIIKVDESKKGVVKALAKQLGGELKVDGNGFFELKLWCHQNPTTAEIFLSVLWVESTVFMD